MKFIRGPSGRFLCCVTLRALFATVYLVKRLLAGINPWLPVFAFVTVFHITRGATSDAVFFALATCLMIADWKRLIPGRMPERRNLGKVLVWSVIVGASLVLYATNRGSWPNIVVLLVILFFALWLAYYRDHGPKPSLTKTMNRTKWVWMTLALAMAVSELFAYIFANVNQDDHTFPTISVLVSPLLLNPVARIIFLTLWSLIGVGLLGVWRKKPGGAAK